ncbi:lantibiotic dehydratase [Thalassotalea sp. 1_MG-2023]|uniref:lantibiotic dehydratase n=1 Tax=Thalassotalea sp. 1_MG-2023 TaxID=3062680 RepID=UPI0026E233B7|nr:lantibiotic dehydratase [Thalassotalea sp. 1_MG-2023]MDO6428886.1 lantibiotic dehydratase [Thalassotalea sp. 1_MG-2023]
MNLSNPYLDQINHSNNFFIRFPVKSINILSKWQGNEDELRAELVSWVKTPEAVEAIYLASPSLFDRLNYWFKNPKSKKGKKIELALTKYFIRMHSRCTPFGTFSGVSVGSISSNSNLNIHQLSSQRISRLDMLIPFLLKKSIGEDSKNFCQLELKANDSIYQINNSFRYIESQNNAKEQIYSLSSIDINPFVKIAIKICQNNVKVTDVIEKICEMDDELTHQYVQEFLQELVKADVLQVVLPTSITKAGRSDRMIDSLRSYKLDEIANTLSNCQKLINSLDTNLEQNIDTYQSIKGELSNLPVNIDTKSSVQADLWHCISPLTINTKNLKGVTRDLADLAAISVYVDDSIADFKERFVSKYEGHAVPFLEALDDENGIGFSNQSTLNTPILDRIVIQGHLPEQNYSLSKLDKLLLSKISTCPNLDEILITKDDVKNLTLPAPLQLPPSYYLSGSLIKNKQEELFIELKGLGGPSAANTLGRFCHLNDKLLKMTQSELALEELLYPNAILAEIVHFPEGKVGNVIARPQLRSYEIPFLADSSVKGDYQIELKDLQIFVQNNRIVLWSIKHNKEVLPRLSCAHNTRDNSLGIYSFLAALQYQNIALPFFKMPLITDEMRYLPRVRLGKLILSPRKWRVSYDEVKNLINNFCIKGIEVFRKKHNLPINIIYKDYDQKLLINLHNILALRAWLASIKKKSGLITIEESLQLELGMALSQGEMSFTNEVVFPLRNSEYIHPKSYFPVTVSAENYQTKFLNGEQWSCYKIYCGESFAEDLLVNTLLPWLLDKKVKRQLNGMFFLRYYDPEFHIRLRLQIVDPQDAHIIQGELFQLLNRLFELGLISDVNTISYTRETTRYGGKEAMLLAEKVFTADSLLALEVLNGNVSDDLLWKVVIWGCDQLLEDLQLSFDSKLKVMANLRRSFGQEFNENIETRVSLGQKFRGEKDSIISLLEMTNSEPFYQHLKDIFAIRSKLITPLAEQFASLNINNKLLEPIEKLAASFLHMHVNRMLKGNARKQELCIYDFLLKYYKQQAHFKSEKNK